MSRETQLKGDKAKAAAISYFTQLELDVSLPITESAPYDLIVDDGAKLQRVQVKYTSSKSVDLRRIHSNSSGYVVKNYILGDYDWLFILDSEGICYLFEQQPSGNHVSLRKVAGVWFIGALLKSVGVQPPKSSNLLPSSIILRQRNSCLGCGTEKYTDEICCM